MNGLRYDFGLLIAYIVPGFLSLYSLSPFVPSLENLFDSGNDEKATITGFSIASLAIVAGMCISLIRHFFIDWTFRKLKVPFFNGEYFDKFEPQEIDYSCLTKQETLGAYLEARATERRPHQFYGNTLVLAFISIPYLYREFKNGSDPCGIILWATSSMILFLILYMAARRACWKFNNAVNKLNSIRN